MTTSGQLKRRERGTGRLYRQNGSANWWMKYHRGGKSIRESTGTSDRTQAEKKLKIAVAQVITGTDTDPKTKKTRVQELAEDLIREYKINGRTSLTHLERRWRLHLKPFFGLLKATQVTSALLARYIDARQQNRAENATINRELAALKRMFNLAREATPPKVGTVPYFPMLRENNVRKGFLETKQHDRLAAECAKVGLWLRAIFETGYTFGWRHEEILAMQVRQINLLAGTIRLEPGTTKNTDGREVTMTKPLKTLIAQCVLGKPSDAYVFTRDDGKRVKDFRKSWKNVTEAAGVQGLMFHDLRRSAARNLRRAGVAEGVIMKIGGWRTRSMFDRYAIVSQSDITDAMVRLQTEQEVERVKVAEEDSQTAEKLGFLEKLSPFHDFGRKTATKH